jgi:hypothetical protein
MGTSALSIGLICLVIGAALGTACGALFSEALRKRFRLVGPLVRHSSAHDVLPNSHMYFNLGTLKTPTLILEGDGITAINEESVRVLVDNEPVILPAEIVEWKEEIAHEQAERKRKGEQYFWNGPKYAVVGFTAARDDISETPQISLRLKTSDYYTFLATQQLDRPMRDGSTLRSRYLSNGPETVPAFMNSSFGANVAMITKDQKLVVTKRSEALGSRPGAWNSSADEALSRSLDSDGETPPSLYDLARRGIDEELAVDREEYRLELLAIAIDTELQQWGATFAAYAHQLTGQDILDRRARGVADKWENDEIEMIDFTVDAVVQCIMNPDRRNNWAPMAPPLFYLALVNFYGKEFTERHCTKALRKYDRQLPRPLHRAARAGRQAPCRVSSMNARYCRSWHAPAISTILHGLFTESPNASHQPH